MLNVVRAYKASTVPTVSRMCFTMTLPPGRQPKTKLANSHTTRLSYAMNVAILASCNVYVYVSLYATQAKLRACVRVCVYVCARMRIYIYI